MSRQDLSETMISYTLHDKVVTILEEKLHAAYIDRERARAERDDARLNMKYAPPMVVLFSHQDWEDGEHVVTVDGDPVGGCVTSEEARSIVRWIGTAWAELIEHNTMRHRNNPASAIGVDAFGNAVPQKAPSSPTLIMQTRWYPQPKRASGGMP